MGSWFSRIRLLCYETIILESEKKMMDWGFKYWRFEDLLYQVTTFLQIVSPNMRYSTIIFNRIEWNFSAPTLLPKSPNPIKPKHYVMFGSNPFPTTRFPPLAIFSQQLVLAINNLFTKYWQARCKRRLWIVVGRADISCWLPSDYCTLQTRREVSWKGALA